MANAQGPSRVVRSIRALFVIAAIGGGLAAFSIVTTRRDVALATGPASPAQRQFYVDAAQRPDLDVFFKALSSDQRLQMARNLANYDDPRVVPVVGKLLGTYDAAARAALAETLNRLAKTQPDAVADLLVLPGSFQQLAIANALRPLGTRAFPLVAKRLSDPAAQRNAGAFLVASGPAAGEELRAQLSSEALPVRLAAADALGKLRVRSALPELTRRYVESKDSDRDTYLSALASIGAPQSARLLREVLLSDHETISLRVQAALGLGRIGGDDSVAALAGFADHPDLELRGRIFEALTLCGDAALRSDRLSPIQKLKVAGGIQSENADLLIKSSLAKPDLALTAAQFASGRPSLVPTLSAVCQQTTDGELIDAALQALATTDSGRKSLDDLSRIPELTGLVARRK